MIADQSPQLFRFIELELDRERHDAISHTTGAAQAREIFFRRCQRELLARGIRHERGDLGLRKHVVIGEGARARDGDAAGAQCTEEALGIADAGKCEDRFAGELRD